MTTPELIDYINTRLRLANVSLDGIIERPDSGMTPDRATKAHNELIRLAVAIRELEFNFTAATGARERADIGGQQENHER